MSTHLQTPEQTLKKAGFATLASAAHLSCEELRGHLDDVTTCCQAQQIHAAACQAHDDALLFEKKILTRASPLLPAAIKSDLKPTDVSLHDYEQWFGGRATQYAAPGDVASMFSPAAYLVALYREALALYAKDSPWHIDARRPDLQGLVLSQENLDTPLSAVSLSNEILLRRARAAFEREQGKVLPDDKVLELLSGFVGSGSAPYHHHHNRLRQVSGIKDPDFEQMQRAPQVAKHLSGPSLAGIYYDISPALYALLTDDISEAQADDKFAKYFPGVTPEIVLQPARLRDWFGLSDGELHELLGTLDKAEYIGRTLSTRVGANIVRVTMSGPSSYINYVRLYPLADGKWLLSFNLKVSRVRTFGLSGDLNLQLTASDFGIDELLPNTQYRQVFEWPNVPEAFNISTVWWKSPEGGGGGHRHSFTGTYKKYSAAAFVLKLNKVVQLHKATGLSPLVIEDVINSVAPDQITKETLAVLFRTAVLSKRYGISHEEALVMARGLISQSARGAELSQFDRLFNDPALVEGGFTLENRLISLHPRHAADDAAVKATLKRACQTDDEGLYELGLALAVNEGEKVTLRLNLSQLSGIHTLGLWARLHGLTPAQLRQTLQMIGLPQKLYSLPAAIWLGLLGQLSSIIGWLDARGWTVHDLGLMTREVGGIAASTEISNLLSDMKVLLADAALPKKPSARDYAQALAPLMGSTFSLGSETATQALLAWADRAKPGGLTLVQACEGLGGDNPKVVAFAYGLAQRALIIHATGVTADMLALLIERPQALVAAAVQGSGTTATLKCNLATVVALADFSEWLKQLPDPAGASGALIAALREQKAMTCTLFAQASALPQTVVCQATEQARLKGDIAHAEKLSSWQEITVVRQWIELASAFNVMPETLGQALALDYVDGADPTWAGWGKVADAFMAGLEPARTKAVQAKAQEPLSRALVGLLAAKEGLDAQRLNQHLLLDSLNGSQVQTSRIAEATAALQLFVHRTLTRAEDKESLRRDALDRQFFRDWTRWNARYATWVAGQMLMYYPENYIDPTVRLGQTKAMDDMLQVLGQAQINTDTVGDAFQGYLSAFEDVANLETVSGYHDSRDAESGKSWFIGRSRGEPREYWWRTVDEGKRSPDGVLPANAWTGWTKIDLAPQVVGSLIRPVVYRERLYLLWVERQENVIARDTEGTPTKHEWQWSYKLAWLRYDGSWTAPLAYALPSQDVAMLEAPAPKISRDELSLFLAARPARNGLVLSLYDRATITAATIRTCGGMAIFEDLTCKPEKTAPLLKRVVHWLDSSTSTGVCAVFDGQNPVAEQRMPVTGGSGIPAGFTRFDALLTSVKVVGASPDSDRYSLAFDSVLTVETNRPEVENKWMTVLVNQFSLLGKETAKVRALVRTEHGAFVVRQEAKGQYFGYLCVERQRFQRAINVLTGIAAVFDGPLHDETYPFKLESTPKGGAYMGRFRINTGTFLLTSMAVRFVDNHGGWKPSHGNVNVAELLANSGWREDQVTPAFYKQGPVKVPGSQVKCVLYSADGKTSSAIMATRDFDLSRGLQRVAFARTLPLGDTTQWSDKQATHRIDFQFGNGNVRRYSVKVYKDADTLRTAIIGTEDNGAQYLGRRGWITRLNTLFARQLTERAISGIDTILSYDTQQIPEPDMGVSVRLTLPMHKASYHGTQKWAQVWLSQGHGRSLLWSGELSETEYAVAEVTFEPGAVYNGQKSYHLETKYPGRHNTAIGGQSIMITQGSLVVTRSSDHGNSKLPKDNVHRVEVLGKNSTPMDFTGANALYFWELFYYTPMMVMQRFLQEERFDLAEQWLKYVFNPAGYTVGGQYTPRMWNVRPLEEDTSWNDEPLKSLDPDAVAQNDPMHYKLNAFMRLLDITIGQGDAAYRKLERDTLTEAKVYYQRALDLLGSAPWTAPDTQWGDPMLGQAASASVRSARMDGLTQLARGVRAATIGAVAGPGFLPEANRVMLGYWEALRIRLYNLRHNLTLDGQPLSLPLYAAPANPKALLAAAVAAEAGGESALPEIDHVPALRFIPLMEGARTMASQLIQFGSTMQNILERRDAEALAELLNTQGVELAASSVALQKQTLNELAAERKTLAASLESATLRRDHYRGLHQENISARERHALNLSTASQTIAAAAKVPFIAAAVVEAVPNIFGFANGGHRPGQAISAIGIGMTLYSDALSVASSRINQEEVYRRRRQDWEIQYKSAQKEMAVIQAQLDALSVRETSASMQIAHMQTQAAQAQAQLALLRGKFTGKKMYSWLRARLATIFYTYYDLTASRCMMAQKALQWEKGDSVDYLRTGSWNGAWAGLLCGEGLMLALGQMENAWVKWQKRELEVTRTVSLAKLFDGRLTVAGQAVSFNTAVKALIDGKSVVVDKLPLSTLTLARTGDLSVQFGLKELGLVAGFENNAMRRVRRIAVTLPALLGPYQDVRARLQTSATGLPAGCHESVISHGMQDGGVFTADGGDSHPRWGAQWLPFEGLSIANASDTGDKTVMTLNFADAKGEQKALLQSLSDIILHVQYTVR